MHDDELWDLEEGFWRGDAPFYEEHLAPDALMVFPAPTGILERDDTVASIREAPRWENVRLTKKHVTRPHVHTAILAYEAQADQADVDSAYRAVCSSTYVKTPDGWRLALHQQTPSE